MSSFQELPREELVEILESLQNTLVWATSTGWPSDKIWKLERLRCQVFGILNPTPNV